MVVPNFRSLSEIQLFSIPLLFLAISTGTVAKMSLVDYQQQGRIHRRCFRGEGGGAGPREWPKDGLRAAGTEPWWGSRGYAPGRSSILSIDTGESCCQCFKYSGYVRRIQVKIKFLGQFRGGEAVAPCVPPPRRSGTDQG